MSSISAASKRQLLSTAKLLEKFAKKDMPGYKDPLQKSKRKKASGGAKKKASGGAKKRRTVKKSKK